MRLVSLAAGGAAGTLCRYLLSRLIHETTGHGFPFGTLAVNALGCLVVGFISMTGDGNKFLTPEVRLLITVGFCGAFTTFSAFMLDTSHLFDKGQMFHALVNVVLNVVAGFLAFYLGAYLAKLIQN